jgi:hypothetical protein
VVALEKRQIHSGSRWSPGSTLPNRRGGNAWRFPLLCSAVRGGCLVGSRSWSATCQDFFGVDERGAVRFSYGEINQVSSAITLRRWLTAIAGRSCRLGRRLRRDPADLEPGGVCFIAGRAGSGRRNWLSHRRTVSGPRDGGTCSATQVWNRVPLRRCPVVVGSDRHLGKGGC